MSVKLEKLSGCKVKLDFVLDSNAFAEAIDEAFEKKIVDVEIKGFRKGKVPREIYMKKFGEESLYEEAMNIAINKAYSEALDKHKLQVVSSPELDVNYETIGRGKKLSFSITFEVWPEVELGQYKGLEVFKDSKVVTDEDVNNYIDGKRKAYAELELVEDGALENGNTAIFDFEGFVDGVAFEGGKAENYSLEIGSGQFIPGFEEQMIGLKIGEEKTITVTFPEEYQAENLKGKKADFKIKLHEIKKRVLPELSDEFVKELELEKINTVAEYVTYVKEVLADEKAEASENKFESDVIKLVVDNAKVDVPEALVQDEVDRLFGQIENQAKMYNITAEQLLSFYGIGDVEQYKKTIEPSAYNNVKQRAVFLKIADVEKVKVLAKDYNAEFELIAEQNNQTVEEVQKVYPKENLLPYLRIRKAMDLVLENTVAK